MFLHQHFKTPSTGGALRSYYLAKALVDRNIRVTVITGYSGNTLKSEKIEGIEVYFLPVPYDNRFGFWKRSVSFLKYNIRAVNLAATIQDIDICYAISVPLTIGVAAYWLKQRYRIKYVFEVGDLWPEAPIQMGFVNNYLFKQVLYGLEKFVYKHAAAIVALSPAIQNSIEKKAPGKTVYLVPNMADTEFYRPAEKNESLLNKFGIPRKFVISYIGAIGLANGLDFYIECARASKQADLPVHFILCGDGALLNYFQRIVKQYQLSNFTILSFQDRQGVQDIMSVTDATFICYKPLPILETGSPNKYFDGLAAGKLIAINFGGWIKQEIEAEHCGIFIDPRDPTNFVRKLEPFVAVSSKLKECQQASRSLAESKYSRKILSEKFVEILMSEVHASPVPSQ